MIIEVMYSCHLCGLHRAKVPVRARVAEDMLFWLQQVMGMAIKEDHARRSPECPATSASDVMVPITGASKIGGSVEN